MAVAAGAAVPRVWSSHFSFLYSAAAAAIGLGSLWRFPYVAGSNGGGAFVLLYIAFVAVLCVPVILAEMIIGRRGQGSTVASVNRLVASEGANPAWRSIGWLSLVIPFVGLSYYSVIAGWCIEYARLAVFTGFAGVDAEASKAKFAALIGSPLQLVILQFLFIAATVWVVGRGLQRGIEWISRIKMSMMFGVLVLMVAYNAFTVGLGPSLQFLFAPDFSQLTGAAVLTAFGQALFSTGIGIGVLMTYSAYVPKGISLPQSSGLLALAVVLVASMAGLAIFPTVFHYGLTPGEGPNLIFVTVPIAFGQMPGGRLVSILFFGLIAIGAFTSAVGMLEPVISWLQERTKIAREWLAVLAGFAIWIIGAPSLLSFNVLADVRPLSFIPFFEKSTFFDVLDMGIANVLLPLNALLIALFAGWVLKASTAGAGFREPGVALRLWQFAVRFLAPAAVLVLMMNA
jgi:NSS family neurotransmitter:Na+ symporter